MLTYFIRIGSLGEVHAARSCESLTRGRRVIVRTSRGVELGEVVRPCSGGSLSGEAAARILRPTTNDDELLVRRLDRHKRDAIESCRAALVESGSGSMLLDVDQLLDGGTLLMHFLGPIDEVAESVTKQVVEKYESIVRTRHFAKLLRDGCGPGCGTDTGRGCGTNCASCAVAVACAPDE